MQAAPVVLLGVALCVDAQFFPPPVPLTPVPGPQFFPPATATLPITDWEDAVFLRFDPNAAASRITNGAHKVSTQLGELLVVSLQLIDKNGDVVRDPEINATVTALSSQGVLVGDVTQYRAGLIVFEKLAYVYHPYLNGPFPAHNHVLDRLTFRIDFSPTDTRYYKSAIDNKLVTSGAVYVQPRPGYSIRFSLTQPPAWPLQVVGSAAPPPAAATAPLPTVRVDLLRSDGTIDTTLPGVLVRAEVVGVLGGVNAVGATTRNPHNTTFPATLRTQGATALVAGGTAVFDDLELSLHGVPRGMHGTYVLRFYVDEHNLPGGGAGGANATASVGGARYSVFSPAFDASNPSGDGRLRLALAPSSAGIYHAGATFRYNDSLPPIELLLTNADGTPNATAGPPFDSLVVLPFPEPNDVKTDTGGTTLSPLPMAGGRAVLGGGVRPNTHGPMRFRFLLDIDMAKVADPSSPLFREFAAMLSRVAVLTETFVVTYVPQFSLRVVLTDALGPAGLVAGHPLPPLRVEVLRSDNAVSTDADGIAVAATTAAPGALGDTCRTRRTVAGIARFEDLTFAATPPPRPNDTSSTSDVVFVAVIDGGRRRVSATVSAPHAAPSRHPRDVFVNGGCRRLAPALPYATYPWLPLAGGAAVGRAELGQGSACSLAPGRELYTTTLAASPCLWSDFVDYTGSLLDPVAERSFLSLLNTLYTANASGAPAGGATVFARPLALAESALALTRNDTGWVRLWARCDAGAGVVRPLCVMFPFLLAESVDEEGVRGLEGGVGALSPFDVPLRAAVEATPGEVSATFYEEWAGALPPASPAAVPLQKVLVVDEFAVRLIDGLGRRWHEDELVEWVCRREAATVAAAAEEGLDGRRPVREAAAWRAGRAQECVVSGLGVEARLGFNLTPSADDAASVAAYDARVANLGEVLGEGPARFRNATAAFDGGRAVFRGATVVGWVATPSYGLVKARNLSFDEVSFPTDLFLKLQLRGYDWVLSFEELVASWRYAQPARWRASPYAYSPKGPPPKLSFTVPWETQQEKLPVSHNATVGLDGSETRAPASASPHGNYWHTPTLTQRTWQDDALKAFVVALAAVSLLVLHPLFSWSVFELAAVAVARSKLDAHRVPWHESELGRGMLFLLSPGGEGRQEVLRQVIPFACILVVATGLHVYASVSSKVAHGWSCGLIGERTDAATRQRRRASPRCPGHAAGPGTPCAAESEPWRVAPLPRSALKLWRRVDGVCLRTAMAFLLPTVVTGTRHAWKAETLYHDAAPLYTACYVAWAAGAPLVLYLCLVSAVKVWRARYEAGPEPKALEEGVKGEETAEAAAGTPSLDAKNMGHKLLQGLEWRCDGTAVFCVNARLVVGVTVLARVCVVGALGVLSTKKTAGDDNSVLAVLAGLFVVEGIWLAVMRPWTMLADNVCGAAKCVLTSSVCAGLMGGSTTAAKVFVALALLAVAVQCACAMAAKFLGSAFMRGRRRAAEAMRLDDEARARRARGESAEVAEAEKRTVTLRQEEAERAVCELHLFYPVLGATPERRVARDPEWTGFTPGPKRSPEYPVVPTPNLATPERSSALYDENSPGAHSSNPLNPLFYGDE